MNSKRPILGYIIIRLPKDRENLESGKRKVTYHLQWIDPVILLWGIYPKELKSRFQRDISIPIFIAELFTIVKIWKQSKCPWTDKWIKKMWHVHTMEYSL